VKWKGLRFENAEELAKAARLKIRKPVAAADVEEIIGFEPVYDGYDLRDLLDSLGWRERPTRSPRQRLVELVDKVRAELPPGFDLDAFLDGLMPGLAYSERRKAADIVLSAVSLRVNTMEPRTSWRFLVEHLSSQFPGRVQLSARSWETIEESFIAVCRARTETIDADALARWCWQQARRIVRRVANRGRREGRMYRQLYVEELVFDHLWFGLPITDSDLACPLEAASDRVWKARCALYDALEKVATPRSFEKLVAAAARLLGKSVSRYDSSFQVFRRLLYRNTTKLERAQLKTMRYEPLESMRGDDPRLR